MLVDEVFNLQRKTQLFRRGTLAILRNIVQTFFGDIMNRRIVEKVCFMFSELKNSSEAYLFIIDSPHIFCTLISGNILLYESES